MKTEVSREKATQVVIDAVTEYNGCKATELASRPEIVMNIGDHDLVELIQELVAAGALFEVEYTLPNSNYRSRSFLLPNNTEVYLSWNYY